MRRLVDRASDGLAQSHPLDHLRGLAADDDDPSHPAAEIRQCASSSVPVPDSPTMSFG